MTTKAYPGVPMSEADLAMHYEASKYDEIGLVGSEVRQIIGELRHWRRAQRVLVVIESPYAGDVEANVAYARAAMRDSLDRGEYPLASHLLYTQPGVLRDSEPDERRLGMEAGLAWRRVADKAVFYMDRGMSAGMSAARNLYLDEGFPFEERRILDGEAEDQIERRRAQDQDD